MKIKLSEIANTIMQQHAVSTFPDECCGFLFGTDENEYRSIELAKEVNNTKDGDKKRRFEIAALDYIKAEQFALQNNTTLIGIYHSHPQHPAIASEHDFKQAMPFFSYIILSVIDKNIDDIKSWKLNEENTEFIEEEFVNKQFLLPKLINS